MIVERLGLNLIPLNFEPDGTFPKGTPDPLQPGNRAEAVQLTKDSHADFAALWDADADRCMFLDEKGEFISGAYITALLADILLEKQGNNNKIIFDPRVIWPTLKVCRQRSAQPLIFEKWPRLHQRSHAKRKCHLRRRNERPLLLSRKTSTRIMESFPSCWLSSISPKQASHFRR